MMRSLALSMIVVLLMFMLITSMITCAQINIDIRTTPPPPPPPPPSGSSSTSSDSSPTSSSTTPPSRPPVAKILDAYIVDANRTRVKQLFVGREYYVEVLVQNTGTEQGTYEVVIRSRYGGFDEIRFTDSVPASSIARISKTIKFMKVLPEDRDVIEICIYRSDSLDDKKDITVSVSVPYSAPFVKTSVTGNNELKENVQGRIIIGLENVAWSRSITNISFKASFRSSTINYNITKVRFARGDNATLTILLTPYEGGEHSLVVTITYRVDVTGDEYVDNFTIPVMIRVNVKASALLPNGTLVPVCVRLNGTCVRDEWMLPGRYVVEAPAESYAAKDVRDNPRSAEIRRSTEITAYYAVHYLVTVINKAGGKDMSKMLWVKEGQTFSDKTVEEVMESEGTRWVFTKWTGDVEVERPELTLTVYRPLTVRALWTRQYRVDLYVKVDNEERSLAFSRWFDEGSQVKLSSNDYAPSNIGFLITHVFTGWQIDAYSYSNSTITLTIDRPQEVVATYGRNYMGLIIFGSGSGFLVMSFIFRRELKGITTLIIRKTTLTIRRRQLEGLSMQSLSSGVEDKTVVYLDESVEVEKIKARPFTEEEITEISEIREAETDVRRTERKSR